MLGWGPVLSTKLGLDPVSSCLPKLRSYTITYKLSCCLRSYKIFLPPTLYKGFLNCCVFYETYCKQQFEAIRIWLLNRSLQLFSPYQDNLFSIGCICIEIPLNTLIHLAFEFLHFPNLSYLGGPISYFFQRPEQRLCPFKFFKFASKCILKDSNSSPHIGLTRRVNKHNSFGQRAWIIQKYYQSPWESVHARMYHIGRSPIQTCIATNVVQIL